MPIACAWNHPLTKHAAVRCQQRGFSEEAILSTLAFGQSYHSGAGTRVHFLGRKALRHARECFGVDVSEWSGTAVIVSPDGAIVTVQHVRRPKRSWRGRH